MIGSMNQTERRRIDGLSIKPGPAQSGVGPRPGVTTTVRSVGGVILGADTLWAFILLLLVIPLAARLYGKRNVILKALFPIIARALR